jgi:hypothetical protein
MLVESAGLLTDGHVERSARRFQTPNHGSRYRRVLTVVEPVQWRSLGATANCRCAHLWSWSGPEGTPPLLELDLVDLPAGEPVAEDLESGVSWRCRGCGRRSGVPRLPGEDCDQAHDAHDEKDDQKEPEKTACRPESPRAMPHHFQLTSVLAHDRTTA